MSTDVDVAYFHGMYSVDIDAYSVDIDARR